MQVMDPERFKIVKSITCHFIPMVACTFHLIQNNSHIRSHTLFSYSDASGRNKPIGEMLNPPPRTKWVIHGLTRFINCINRLINSITC